MSEKTAQTAATTRSYAAAPATQVTSLSSYLRSDSIPFHCDALSIKPVHNDSGRAIVMFCQKRNGLVYAVYKENETYVGSDGKTYKSAYQMVISANLYKSYLDVKSQCGEDIAVSFLLSSPVSTVTSQSGKSFVMVVSDSTARPVTDAIDIDI